MNRDFKGKVPGRADDVKKRNSQTVQARLVQAQANQEPICLFVYGTRDNDKSLFFNILQFKDISEEDKEKYNNLPGYDDPNRKGKLAELKRFACET